ERVAGPNRRDVRRRKAHGTVRPNVPGRPPGPSLAVEGPESGQHHPLAPHHGAGDEVHEGLHDPPNLSRRELGPLGDLLHELRLVHGRPPSPPSLARRVTSLAVGPWGNGSPTDSGSVSPGSNPGGPAANHRDL